MLRDRRPLSGGIPHCRGHLRTSERAGGVEFETAYGRLPFANLRRGDLAERT
jgi:hypothetical protein